MQTKVSIVEVENNQEIILSGGVGYITIESAELDGEYPYFCIALDVEELRRALEVLKITEELENDRIEYELSKEAE